METKNQFNRRDFIRLMGLGAATAALLPPLAVWGARDRKFQIGATFILWGYGPDNLEPALKDISELGYHAFETFGSVIQEWEEKRGGLNQLIEKYQVPLISGFCMTDVLDPSKKKDELKKLVHWARLLKKNGGKVVEYCASGIDREKLKFDYREHKQYMIESMNDYAKAVTDEGLVCALHPHTGTPIETEEEVYFVMENLNTDYMKFGPDVGQLEKGGADPVKIVKDFIPLIEHVHLKDFEGGDNGYLGYAPLGVGHVKLKKILDLLEQKRDQMAGMIMFELDFDRDITPRWTPDKAAELSRDYLQSLGYTFNH
ncbi:sugar phosphate isomerase/epimerase family protein [Parapedobacter koreensis]|uniref:Inosose dehydratase n=1 Tax=Parapedobacter koreensis TaxID=332977 RepID=A0A1H7L1D8_9SPHI|nr:sugar phosphate isomerase/epimerase [Parapedobacter koreensis]SEK92654.1 inosose dehydratase [Parapedobacter koreensis]